MMIVPNISNDSSNIVSIFPSDLSAFYLRSYSWLPGKSLPIYRWRLRELNIEALSGNPEDESSFELPAG
jgi:hypothetical protein